MEVYLKYGDIWLRIKEAYTITSAQPKARKKRGKTQRSSPYGLVAESVENLDLKGFKFKSEIKVPATKVSRFAARIRDKPLNVVVVIEEDTAETYKATVYGRSKKEVDQAVHELLEELSRLQTGRRRKAEEEEEEVEVFEEEAE